MIKEFKEFAMRGNVVDLAVAVIIGGAFGKIVNSAIDDLIMPIIGKVVGNVDFKDLYFPLSDKVAKGLDLAAAKKLGPVFAWGNFVTILIQFLILAFCIFLMIKLMNKLKKKEEAKPAAPASPSNEEKLLMEIRDAIRTKN